MTVAQLLLLTEAIQGIATLMQSASAGHLSEEDVDIALARMKSGQDELQAAIDLAKKRAAQ